MKVLECTTILELRDHNKPLRLPLPMKTPSMNGPGLPLLRATMHLVNISIKGAAAMEMVTNCSNSNNLMLVSNIFRLTRLIYYRREWIDFKLVDSNTRYHSKGLNLIVPTGLNT